MWGGRPLGREDPLLPRGATTPTPCERSLRPKQTGLVGIVAPFLGPGIQPPLAPWNSIPAPPLLVWPCHLDSGPAVSHLKQLDSCNRAVREVTIGMLVVATQQLGLIQDPLSARDVLCASYTEVTAGSQRFVQRFLVKMRCRWNLTLVSIN